MDSMAGKHQMTAMNSQSCSTINKNTMQVRCYRSAVTIPKKKDTEIRGFTWCLQTRDPKKQAIYRINSLTQQNVMVELNCDPKEETKEKQGECFNGKSIGLCL